MRPTTTSESTHRHLLDSYDIPSLVLAIGRAGQRKRTGFVPRLKRLTGGWQNSLDEKEHTHLVWAM
jgi:hypothetical protein